VSARSMDARPGRRRFVGMALAGAATLLAGCGRKPSRVDPPEDAGPDALRYPWAYPNKNSDPHGTVPPSQAVVPPGTTPAPATQTPATQTPATASPPPRPLPPQQSYPKIITPQDLQPNGSLGGSGTWPDKP